MSRTALISGKGRLPQLLAERLQSAGESPLLAEMEGFESQCAGFGPVERFRLERLVPFLDRLQDQGVTRAVFAGAVHRPRLDPSLIDPATVQLLPRIMAAMQQGDDGTLREVIALMGEWGIDVVGAQDICPELLADAGVLGDVQPSSQDKQDAMRGFRVLQVMGAADVGQGCVVARGQCLAMEALPGTDVMLAHLADLRAQGVELPAGGVFCKAPKPDQDRRIDLPALGPDTVDAVHRAGLRGIAFDAGGVLLIDRDQMLAQANALGVFLWAMDAP
ncbi:LpxI family protein [Roseinatronobacter alkalisoli]|uniref:UDP-2,3-diacylglucosamine diphosphatase LpxI n=1 Tax=Roseinatronobacter alkalisoli TaxID=3028235 RepID=A0ABT5T4R7_9RHOB|nr:UDP-2,3-diacylglucosamine diphosphatase LpxI [Roseinatronobacter sp. HJB301]MDD7970107.1 UDP-2,3-diacylglucosamine diphosphatase LpxI [Roseinatronobacter sp. HJB301]